MIPQQAASTVTNVDDIEAYIRSKDHSGKTYLTAIDLPMRDRKHVIRELGYRSESCSSSRPPKGNPKPSPNRHQRRRAKTGRLKAIGALRVGKLPRRDSNPRPAG